MTDVEKRPGTEVASGRVVELVASVMSTARDNIHKVHAGPGGVRGLDSNTRIGDHVGFAFLEIGEVSRSAEDIGEASSGERFGGY